jgi:SAM-dependent methyltransferase
MADTETPASTGLPLPPENLRFMNDSGDRIVSSGKYHADWLRRQGMPNDARLLDVGSGYGRLAIGLVSSDFTGQYLGFDILRPHVRWCRRNLTPYTSDRFRFRHLDIRNSRYNPKGVVLAPDARFPADDNSHEWAAVFSVFTHMYEADIRRYLAELRRVLRPGGNALTTWFLFDDERLSRATDPDRTPFPMDNQINEVTRFTDPIDPLHAIAYDEQYARSMVTDAGLRVDKVARGSWCGEKQDEYQDFMVLSKPRRRVRRLARRAVGKVRRIVRA